MQNKTIEQLESAFHTGMMNDATRALVNAMIQEQSALTMLLGMIGDFPGDRYLLALDGISDVTKTLHGILNEIERKLKLNAKKAETPQPPQQEGAPQA